MTPRFPGSPRLPRSVRPITTFRFFLAFSLTLPPAEQFFEAKVPLYVQRTSPSDDVRSPPAVFIPVFRLELPGQNRFSRIGFLPRILFPLSWWSYGIPHHPAAPLPKPSYKLRPSAPIIFLPGYLSLFHPESLQNLPPLPLSL